MFTFKSFIVLTIVSDFAMSGSNIEHSYATTQSCVVTKPTKKLKTKKKCKQKIMEANSRMSHEIAAKSFKKLKWIFLSI